MKDRFSRIYCCFLVVLVVSLLYESAAYTQEDFFLTLSNSRVRMLSMGGAFTAIEGDIGALSFNPGSYYLFRDRSKFRLAVVINPILPSVSNSQSEYFTDNRDDAIESLFDVLRYTVKSIGISYDILDIGVLFNEELFLRKKGGQIFNGKGFTNNYYHSIIANIKLSSQVSFGVSGIFIKNTHEEKIQKGSGFSYGILIKPSEFYQVGITYIDYSDKIKNFRKLFDRFADESLNAGIAFLPWKSLRFCLDVRNLTENDKPENFGLQELHYGVEFARIPHVVLRCGYYREKETDTENNRSYYNHIYSLGIGLIDINRLKSLERKFNHETPLVSYAVIYEKTPFENVRWHMLKIGIQF